MLRSQSAPLKLGPALSIAAAQLQVDAKQARTRSGAEGWYPYYAGYSETFVKQLLEPMQEYSPLRVVDPWNGSGTTTRIAHRIGHSAFGFDINPVAVLVASARLAHPSDAAHVSGLARRIASVPPVPVSAGDPLLAWLHSSIVSEYRGIEDAIFRELATDHRGVASDAQSGKVPPLAAFLLMALIRAAREAASVRPSSNPTWIRPAGNPAPSSHSLGGRWIEIIAHMARDLAQSSSGREAAWSGTLGVADSRHLPLPDASVDLVVTSPPYCTRIDYVISSSFALAALGLGPGMDGYDRLRRASMGTPLSRLPTSSDPVAMWPTSVATMLNSVRSHPSKASQSYYYRTYWQYFDDAIASLAELYRVLRPGGAAALVVQSSFYKDIPIDLPNLYVDCAKAVGMEAHVALAMPVRQAMSRVNPHSRKYKCDKEYVESIVVLERSLKPQQL